MAPDLDVRHKGVIRYLCCPSGGSVSGWGRGGCKVKVYTLDFWGVLRGDAYIMGGRVLCQSMCPPPSGHAQALAHAQARRRTRIGPAKLTLCPDHASLDLSTADPAEDRARRVTVQPAPLFNNQHGME